MKVFAGSFPRLLWAVGKVLSYVDADNVAAACVAAACACLTTWR